MHTDNFRISVFTYIYNVHWDNYNNYFSQYNMASSENKLLYFHNIWNYYQKHIQNIKSYNLYKFHYTLIS